MKMFRKINLIAFSGLLLFTLSCNEPDDGIADTEADVIIINEGNFSSGDGTFSTYNTFSKETYSCSCVLQTSICRLN